MAPIHDAVYGGTPGHVEAVRRELAAGVSPDLLGECSAAHLRGRFMTPLMNAAAMGRRECTRLLLEAGADVNICTLVQGEGVSPLILACRMGNKDVVAMLLAAGASVSPPFNIVPVESLQHGSHKHIVPWLLRAGSPLPRLEETEWMQPDVVPRYLFDAAATEYVNAVAAAGGYVPYARAHRKKLAAIFIPKFPQVPAEVVPTIVEFWAFLGHY